MYKKQPIRKRQEKIYVIIYNKNKLLFMPFATKQKIKIQGNLGTLRHFKLKNKTLYWLPPILGEKHCPQWFEKENAKKREDKGRGKLTIYWGP